MGILNRKKTAEKKDDAVKKAAVRSKASADKAEKKKETAKGTETKAESKAPRVIDEKNLAAYALIREPLFTEKADKGQAGGKYTFYVDPSANKTQISLAIKTVYGVEPVAVRVLVVKGKKVRHGRSTGRRKDRKKAIVTLKPGDTLAVME